MQFTVPNKPVLVAGATGAIGQEVVRALLEQGAPVRVFVRTLAKVAALPDSVERFVGDMTDREAVERAVRGVHAVFFVSPHDDAEEQIAEYFVTACSREGVRVVFAGVHADGANRVARLLQRLLFGLMMPHYKAKLRIAERVRTSRANPVVLVPGNYYQNDEICREQILTGTYPMPLRLFPRVDTRDVGDAAARALLDPSVRSGAYSLVGPESLSGEQTAATWSAALGREIRYTSDISLTDSLLESAYGGRKALDFQKTYRLAAKFAMKTTAAQLQQTVSLIGRQPRSHSDYVRDTLTAWHSAKEETGTVAKA
jgi:uncharacterized protein YbjT (DUF2867 family)